jgi:hypothetical protein
LHHYELQLPKLTEEEREYAVFQTGGIPLYLSQLLISKVNLEEPSLASLLLPVKRLVKLRVSEFFTRKTEELKTHTTRLTKCVFAHSILIFLTLQNRYYQLMEACVSEKLCDIVDPDLYDHRYFYFLPDKNPISERERGRCICGIAQQAMLDTLFQLKFDDFNLDLWYTALERIAGNRAMQGIIAEKIILHGIYSNGLRSVNSQLDKMGRRFFDDTPDWSSNISRTLYVPTSSSFEAIDGIILMQAGEDAHLFPIQITIIPRHKDSESTFFAKRWGEWVKPLQDRGLKIHTTFVWIDLQPPSEKHRTARVQELRTRDILVNPEYRSTHLGISQVDSRLGELLSLPIYMLLRISS